MNAPTHTATGTLTDGATCAAQDQTVLSRLMRWLACLFDRKPDVAALLTSDIDPRFDSKAIEKLLAAVRQQGTETSDSSIQMVHFGALPQAIGRRWTGYVERAMHLSEGVLLKRLDPDDFFTRYADFAFIVVFADTEDHAAPKKADALSEDIQHRLLLDRQLAQLLPVREVIARIIDLLGEKTPLKIRKLAEALDNNAKLKEKEACKARKKKSSTNTAELAAKEKSRGKGETAKAKPAIPKAKASDKSDNKFKTLSAHPSDGPEAALPDWMGKFSAAFRPMLHVNNRVVGIHACIPQRTTPDQEELVGEAVYPKGGVGQVTTSIDLLLARFALDELRLAVSAGNKTQISVMATLNSLATSNDLIDLIMGLDQKQNKQLIVEIAGILPSTPPGQLSDTTGKLRGNVRSVNLLVRLLDTKFKPFADAGVNAIGCNISAPDLRNLKAEMIAGAMTKFVENAKAVNLGTYFHGVDSGYLRDAASKAGVDFITGDAFEPAVSQPGSPRMLKT